MTDKVKFLVSTLIQIWLCALERLGTNRHKINTSNLLYIGKNEKRVKENFLVWQIQLNQVTMFISKVI